jgi:hypothetical protein
VRTTPGPSPRAAYRAERQRPRLRPGRREGAEGLRRREREQGREEQIAAHGANLGTTSIYLQGIDPEKIIAAVHARRAPMMSASAGPQL